MRNKNWISFWAKITLFLPPQGEGVLYSLQAVQEHRGTPRSTRDFYLKALWERSALCVYSFRSKISIIYRTYRTYTANNRNN